MPSVASTDGVTVDYLHLAGSGRPLLMVHATGFCSTVWRPVAEALADEFSCWALDVRGHGRSNPPDDGFRWTGTAADVLAVVDDLAAEAPGPWLGVGHSMGGASLLLAEQARPGTFAALWAYEPIVFPDVLPDDAPDPSNPLSEGALRRRATFASPEAAHDNYAAKPPMSAFDDRALRGYLERGLIPDPDADPATTPDGVRLACAPEVEAQVYRMGGRHHAWAGLSAVSCPVTVVVGDPAVPGPAAFAPGIAERLPAGVLEPHPELGHFGPMEDPDAIAASIRAAVG